jgi:hypothetical protein
LLLRRPDSSPAWSLSEFNAVVTHFGLSLENDGLNFTFDLPDFLGCPDVEAAAAQLLPAIANRQESEERALLDMFITVAVLGHDDLEALEPKEVAASPERVQPPKKESLKNVLTHLLSFLQGLPHAERYICL